MDIAKIGNFHKSHPFQLPLVGTTIRSPNRNNEYKIGPALGQGAFGRVFECTDVWKRSLVAKVIDPSPEWEETEARAVAEALAMAIARCPETVHVYDIFAFHGACYIISERCDFTVRQLMQLEGFNPYFWIEGLCKAVLGALDALHSNLIAHCDVHPGNVFLKFVPDAVFPTDIQRSASAFKVGDFGSARLISNMSPYGTFLKVAMPPEAISPDEFGPVDARADVYQAGLLFLSVLSKKEQKWTKRQIIEGKPREAAESLNTQLGAALAMLLRRHVDCRPQSALEAWLELERALKDN